MWTDHLFICAYSRLAPFKIDGVCRSVFGCIDSGSHAITIYWTIQNVIYTINYTTIAVYAWSPRTSVDGLVSNYMYIGLNAPNIKKITLPPKVAVTQHRPKWHKFFLTWTCYDWMLTMYNMCTFRVFAMLRRRLIIETLTSYSNGQSSSSLAWNSLNSKRSAARQLSFVAIDY